VPIEGEQKGVELHLLPSQLTTWADWKAQYPHTLAMTNDFRNPGYASKFDNNFMIGLILGEDAKAFFFTDVLAASVINTELGDTPIVFHASGTSFQAFIRQVETEILTFALENGTITDNETGSTWNFSRGLAIDGSLRGQGLQPAPSISAYD